MSRHVDVVVVTDACGMHQTSHLPLIFVQFFVVIVHGGLFLKLLRFLIQMVTKSSYAITTKDAEHVSLLLSKFWRCFSTERRKVWM